MDNEIAVVKAETAGIALWAQNLVVATVEDYKEVVKRIQVNKVWRQKWVAYWNIPKTAAHEAWKSLVGKEKEGLDIFDQAEYVAKTKALTWKQAEDQKAAEQQRKLQAIADEKARRERERLEKEAAALKTPELKEARLEQAAAVEAPVITVASPTIDIAGASSRKTWKAELVEVKDLIASAVPGSVASSFLEFNQQAANNFARSTKGKVPVAGVRFYEVEGMSIRNGG